MPRFHGDNFMINLELVKQLQKIAQQKGCTPAQLAIGWIKNLSRKDGNPEILPIPGATTAARVKENAEYVMLSDSEISRIEKILDSFQVKGTRYAKEAMASTTV